MILFFLFLAHLVVAGMLLTVGLKIHVAWVGASALIALACAVYRLVRGEPLGLPRFSWSVSQHYYDADDDAPRRYFGVNPGTGLPMDNPFMDIGGNLFGSDIHINRD